MKPKSIKCHQKLKRGAFLGAGTFILFQIGSAFVLLYLRMLCVYAWLSILLLLLAAANLITIPLVLIVLKQRVKEIEGGEFDGISQY